MLEDAYADLLPLGNRQAMQATPSSLLPGPGLADLATAAFIIIDIPAYAEDLEEAGIPRDMLLLKSPSGTRWVATVRLDDGQIENWPPEFGPANVFLKVKDQGRYTLLDGNQTS